MMSTWKHGLTRTMRVSAAVALALLTGSCHDSVTGPKGPLVFENAELLADSTFVGSAGSEVTPRLSLRVLDGSGNPVRRAVLTWSVIAGDGRVDHAPLYTNENGEASAEWYVGTKAGEPQALAIEARMGGARAALVLTGLVRPLAPEAVRLLADTITVDLGTAVAPALVATDIYGNEFAPSGIEYRLLAGTAVALGNDGRVVGTARGTALVESRVNALADTAVIRVIQRVGTIDAEGPTTLNAVGAAVGVRTALSDVHGAPVLDSVPLASSADTTVVRVAQRGDSLFLTSVGTGLTTITLRAGDVTRAVPVAVRQVAATVSYDSASLSFASLADTAVVHARVLDSAGTAIAGAQVGLAPRDPSIIGVDPTGLVRALANGTTQLVISINGAPRDSITVTVRQLPASIAVAADSFAFGALGASARLDARARDATGHAINDLPPIVAIGDPAVVRATADVITALANGSTDVTLKAGNVQERVVVVVAQRATRIVPATDSVVIAALGARVRVAARVVDSLGNIMADTVRLTVADPSVTGVVGSDSLEALATGATTVVLAAGDRQLTIPVRVWQRPDHIVVDETRFAQPLSLTMSAKVIAGGAVVDANGHAIPGAPLEATVDDSAVAAVFARDTMVIRGSGATTVRLRSGTLESTRQLRVYLPPELAERRIATTIDADTALGNPWAPTLTMAPDGQVRLYFAAYKRDPAVNQSRADLAYLTSSDTMNFHYAGTAIPHQNLMSDPYGWGIENVAVVSRIDGPGLRMYFSGGSYDKGWQVFSSVGDGIGPWTPEPGVRVGYGDLHLYPQGEGMVLIPDATGGLRLILGSMQLASAQAGSWAIVEFHSVDGLQWDYSREVLRPGVPGSGTERAVYSPTIVPFGKGAWRMFYTGDNLNRVPGGGKSEMWSAVSFDRQTWIVEGVIIPAVDGNLYYASALGNKVAYIRTPATGGTNKIEIAQMIQR